MTYVIITAGIDLSVGSVLVFSGVVAAKADERSRRQRLGRRSCVGLVGGAGLRARPGASSTATLITTARIPPLIVTLGTLGMASGAALLITGGTDERYVPTKLVDTIGIGRRVRPDPVPRDHRLAVGASCSASSSRLTRFGRYTYAVGSNVEARAARRHHRRPPPDQGLRARRDAGRPGRLPEPRALRARPRSVGTPPTTSTRSPPSCSAAPACSAASARSCGTVVGVFIPAVLQNGFVISACSRSGSRSPSAPC